MPGFSFFSRPSNAIGDEHLPGKTILSNPTGLRTLGSLPPRAGSAPADASKATLHGTSSGATLNNTFTTFSSPAIPTTGYGMSPQVPSKWLDPSSASSVAGPHHTSSITKLAKSVQARADSGIKTGNSMTEVGTGDASSNDMFGWPSAGVSLPPATINGSGSSTPATSLSSAEASPKPSLSSKFTMQKVLQRWLKPSGASVATTAAAEATAAQWKPTSAPQATTSHPTLVSADSKDVMTEQQQSVLPPPPAVIVLPTVAAKKEKLTPEQKQAKALAERERRLQEVLSVLEGRKRLPDGMEDLQFANFIGDGTYGFVVTAWRGTQEVAVKFIFRDKIPATAWMHDEKYGDVPSEIYFLANMNHPNLVSLLGCYKDENYIMAVTELHGTSWDYANPVLQQKPYEGLRTTPRAQRVGSEGKGDLNTLSSLSASQREMLRPRVSCDLFECIDAHEYFPENIVRHIFRQVVDVVAYLYSKNIVHRDLKDENIVIDEAYNIKLIDFGSAAFIPSEGKPLFDKFLGTMDFAAPEIIEGYKYRGPEVEVWALGVLLYILVFRQIPFKSQQDTVTVVYRKPVELIDFYPGAHQLYDLLDKMLVHDASRRVKVQDILAHPWFAMGQRA
ncbi:kinase-like domain-containing protein [Blastocladiella britannica]|nr:kinase-like domain-containing protein [Blastocladiella britannica]